MKLKTFKRNLKDLDKPLLFITVAFFLFGLLNIVTASSREAVVRYDASLYHYFFQQLKMLAIGFVGFLIIINVDTKHYKWIGPLAFFGVLFLLVYLTMVGEEHKGAKNWLNLGGFSFQPSELAKPIIIVCLACLFEIFGKKLKNKKIPHYDMIGIIIFVGLFAPFLVFLQKDFGTMLILGAIFFIMFVASPIRRIEKLKTMIVVVIVGIMGCCVMLGVKGYILSDAQLARFDFFNPCSKYENGGYQICNGFIALNDGGLLGLGIGKSKQKYSYIPEPHTDSVFAIIGEEWGFLKSTLIFIFYIYIIKHILDLSSKASTTRGRFICLGVATYIFMHVLINLGGLFGIMPLTGVPLPFLSYGGTFAISLIGSLSIVQRVAIETKNKKITLGKRI